MCVSVCVENLKMRTVPKSELTKPTIPVETVVLVTADTLLFILNLPPLSFYLFQGGGPEMG